MRPCKALLLATSFAAACGGADHSSGGATTPPNGGVVTPSYVVTISNMAYSPLNLAVPPGATVTVVNADSMLHSVTSESAPAAFTPGAVAGISFDTGEFSSGSKSFTIPSSAADGTVIPYYCTFHLSTMRTPNGTITVSTSAASTSKPAPTPVPMPGTY